jgi:hypothetical protein
MSEIVNEPIKNPPALTIEYVETYKFNKWVEYFTDDKNPKTFGNATQSAIAAYPNQTYATAAQSGHSNIRKYKYLSTMIGEKLGLTLDKMLKIGANKMMKSDNPRWWENMMLTLGYTEEQIKQQGIAVKTENKDGTTTEIKIVNFEAPKTDDKNIPDTSV